MLRNTIAIILILFVASSCKKAEDQSVLFLSPAEQLAKDVAIIEDYLDQEGLVAQQTASSLYYIIDEEGTDGHPTSTADVQVTYRGIFPDGTEFDSGDKVTFNLGGVIAGWREGIPLFMKNGKGKLLIPSGLAYGPQGAGSIPRNQVIIFDVELHNFL